MKLERFCYSKFGTFGKLTVVDHVFYTVEKPWENNEPFISCIPEGIYQLEPHESKKYDDTFALVNTDLKITHYKEPDSKRYACLIHAANWPKDVKGCIGPGLNYTIANNEMMVTHSRKATRDLLEIIEENMLDQLEITHFKP